LITGTPGTGKSTLSELIAMATGLMHLNCSQIVKEHKLHSGYDESFDTLTLDEDKVRNTHSTYIDSSLTVSIVCV
jgi:broad-specificity NMP kinase